jgi:predicted small secreted protein
MEMMKRSVLVVSLILVVALGATACYFPGLNSVRGNGRVVEENRDVHGFEGISLGGIGDLHIEVGSSEGLRIVAEENLMRHIESDVRGDILHIKTRTGVNLRPTESIDYYLTVTNLQSITLSGLGRIDAPALEATAFEVDISGAGDIQIAELNADRLDVAISGLGGLDIDGGYAERQHITISGSGNCTTRELESQEANVRISGLGSATVWASDRLDAAISGSGSVRYVGNPQISQSISGLGSVRPASE